MSDALIAAIRSAWRDASLAAPGTRAWRAVRLARPGPLAVLAAIRETDQAVALLFEAPIADAPPVQPRFEADGVSMIEERNYGERTYRIAVTLERNDLDNIFTILLADLVEAAAPHAAPAPAVAALFARLATWQAFLRARRSGLGWESVIGLIGELVVLRRLALVAGWQPAVEAWKGPAGGLHDFLGGGQGIEVKTTAGVTSALQITSLDQMEDAGLAALLLAHVHLLQTPAGFNLPMLVGEIGDELTRRAPVAVRMLRDALLAAGYADADAVLYEDLRVQVLSQRAYRISPGFPRLTRSTVAQGIGAASYRIELRAIQTHLVDDAAADAIMRQMGDAV
jgi:Putative  PD-(D/E)XK family member, (DUF4420)